MKLEIIPFSFYVTSTVHESYSAVASRIMLHSRIIIDLRYMYRYINFGGTYPIMNVHPLFFE